MTSKHGGIFQQMEVPGYLSGLPGTRGGSRWAQSCDALGQVLTHVLLRSGRTAMDSGQSMVK